MRHTRSGTLFALVVAASITAVTAAEAVAQVNEPATPQGLIAEFYSGASQDFTGAIANTLYHGPIDFLYTPNVSNTWPMPPSVTNPGTPPPATVALDFSVRWQGVIRTTAATGLYTFFVTADDGVRLWVNHTLVCDGWRDQGATPYQNTITLTGNTNYAIRMEMHQGGGDARATLEWTPPGGARAIVPAANLFRHIAPPRLSVAQGTFASSFVLTMSHSIEGAAITYTVNGGASTPYTGPVFITATTTIVATATRTGLLNTGNSVTALYTISPADATPPRLREVRGRTVTQSIAIFNEPLADTSATAANFAITPGINVTGATLSADKLHVVLTIDGATPLVAGTNYTMTLNPVVAGTNVRDRVGGGNVVPQNTAYNFTHRPVRSTNLVDWVRFDEGTGTAAADSSGDAVNGGNAGTFNPAGSLPVWVDGVFGTSAVQFDGVNDVVTFSDFAPVLGGTASLAMWLKTEGKGNVDPDLNDRVALLGNKDAGANDVYWGMITGNQNHATTPSTIGIAAGDVAGSVTAGNPAFNNGTWRHVAFTRDSGGAGPVQVYVNGTSVAAVNSNPGVKTGAFTTLARVAGGLNRAFYIGAVDDMTVYNAIIGANDVVDMVNTPPVPNAGPDQLNVAFTTPPIVVTMAGSVTDDGLPAPSTLTNTWSQVSGPAATINTPGSLTTTINLPAAATYVFRLTVTDGRLRWSDDMTVNVNRISISSVTGLVTTELNNGTATFTISLNSVPQPPGTTVSILLTSSDPSEGLLSLTGAAPFTTNVTAVLSDTNMSQVVTIQGQDDFFPDGDIAYTITTAASTSTDSTFSGINLANPAVTNTDNDSPGILIAPLTSVVTSESGTTATFDVVLQSQPQPAPGTTVAIQFTSSNPAEALVSTTGAPATQVTVTFNGNTGVAGGWDVPQTVTITGVDDTVLDFTQTYVIVSNQAVSTDANYSAINPPDIGGINNDNEVIPDAPEAWGNCGLMGLELMLPLGLILGWRRRRRS